MPIINKLINNFSGKELSQSLQVLALFTTNGYEVRKDIFDIVGEAIDLQAHSQDTKAGLGKKVNRLPVVGQCQECEGTVVRYSCRRTECYECGLVVRGPRR